MFSDDDKRSAKVDVKLFLAVVLRLCYLCDMDEKDLTVDVKCDGELILDSYELMPLLQAMAIAAYADEEDDALNAAVAEVAHEKITGTRPNEEAVN